MSGILLLVYLAGAIWTMFITRNAIKSGKFATSEYSAEENKIFAKEYPGLFATFVFAMGVLWLPLFIVSIIVSIFQSIGKFLTKGF